MSTFNNILLLYLLQHHRDIFAVVRWWPYCHSRGDVSTICNNQFFLSFFAFFMPQLFFHPILLKGPFLTFSWHQYSIYIHQHFLKKRLWCHCWLMMLMIPLKDVLCHSIMCTFLSEINSHRSFMHLCTFHLTTSSLSS